MNLSNKFCLLLMLFFLLLGVCDSLSLFDCVSVVVLFVIVVFDDNLVRPILNMVVDLLVLSVMEQEKTVLF